jgi:hypothetical protein
MQSTQQNEITWHVKKKQAEEETTQRKNTHTHTHTDTHNQKEHKEKDAKRPEHSSTDKRANLDRCFLLFSAKGESEK